MWILRFVLVVLAVCIFVFLITIAIYRVPSGASKRIEAEIRYQMIDTGQYDLIRFYFESVLRNRRVFLKSDTVQWLYVSRDDFYKCWPELPSAMREKHHTIRAVFEVKQLWLARGFAVATIVDTQRVEGEPFITK